MKGKYPHIEWLDLHNNGVATECAIMKRDESGNIYFFTIQSLDMVDRKRLLDLVSNPNAQHQPLFDMMAGTRLRNGMNALEYFHQLVKIKTPSGQIIDIDPTRRGLAAQETIANSVQIEP